MSRRTVPGLVAAVAVAAAFGAACSPLVVKGPATTAEATATTEVMPAISDLPAADVPEGLRYVFQRRMSDGDESGEIVLGSSNGDVVPILASDGEWLYSGPQVSPDGEYISVTGTSRTPDTLGDQTIFLAQISNLPTFDSVPTGLRQFTCARWAPDSESIVVSREVASGGWRVSSIDIRSGLISDLWDDSYGPNEVPCGLLVDEQTFVYYVANEETGAVGVWQRDLRTDRVESVIEIADCFTVYPIPRPGTDEVAVISNCDDDDLDGLRLVSLSGGSVRHVLRGLVGGPAWSPDGDWLLFVLAVEAGTTDDPGGTDLWIARADGSEATRLQGPFATWPSWIPASADCSLCPVGNAGG